MDKNVLISVVGVWGSIIAHLFGGWDSALTTMVIFMGIDYIMGLLVAGVFHKSNKTADGSLASMAGFKGLCKKGAILAMVLVAFRLDVAMGTDIIRNAVIIGYICNESISIIENAGLMGIPIPKKLIEAIEVLKSKGDR